ncbi:MAG: hypothetical protein M3478_13440 [Planctomycetota bacterium]|nr:hypothetical protein [Planctomycetota bacterium]
MELVCRFDVRDVPDAVQFNDSGIGSTAGSVAGSQMAKQVPFGSQIGGFFGRKTEKAVRGQARNPKPNPPPLRKRHRRGASASIMSDPRGDKCTLAGAHRRPTPR